MNLQIGDRIWLMKQLWLAEQYDYDMKQPILFEVLYVDGEGFHKLKNLNNGSIIYYGKIYEPKWKKETIDIFEI